jgi:hypothetical protein
MERFTGQTAVIQTEASRDRAAMTARVTADATRAFAGADPAALARYAQEAVAELWTDGIRVTSFVAVLAQRGVRERLAAAAPRPIRLP